MRVRTKYILNARTGNRMRARTHAHRTHILQAHARYEEIRIVCAIHQASRACFNVNYIRVRLLTPATSASREHFWCWFRLLLLLFICVRVLSE